MRQLHGGRFSPCSVARETIHVRIDELTDIAAHHQVAALLDRVWHAAVIDASTLHALSHVGNYIAGAYDGQLVGAAVGFFAADGHLHSHVTGVAPEYQGRGIGFALKQHQRDWALARNRTAISWTFDPLVARNAYFNLHKLGATVTAYLPDFYGPMDDAINAGDATDRLFVMWHLHEPVPSAPNGAGAAVLVGRDGNVPIPGTLRGSRVSVATPHDIERLRVDDPALAVRWRMEVRDALAGAMEAGYRITGITRDGQYLVEAP
jgi:predicted GNAT superfamily acetyltransferase